MIVEYVGQKVDLLPCPFCGGEPAIYSHNWVAGYHIYCTGDDCPMSPVTNARRTLEEAAADWNHRADEGAAKGAEKPKCFYNDNGSDRCLGMAPADGYELERSVCESAADAIETLLAERDAAVEDLRGMCWCCAHGKPWEKAGPLSRLTGCEHLAEVGVLVRGGRNRQCPYWQWRGPQKEAVAHE